MFDAHVHCGYFNRKGEECPCYYSPRRISGVLERSGIKEYIVSSTCAQIRAVRVQDMIAEAEELHRQAFGRAHVFFWLSGHLYEQDKKLRWLDSGYFEGVKFHECETRWLGERRKELYKILEVLESRGVPVQFHTGPGSEASPSVFTEIVSSFKGLRFDLAHCSPMDEMNQIVRSHENVWTDTADFPLDCLARLREYDWQGRLMFGTDLPIWQAHERIGLLKRHREYVRVFKDLGYEEESCSAFRAYLGDEE